jgi:Inhibitor of growth proteins N-terminal histone-binding
MQQRQQDYIRKGEEKLMALQVVAPPADALATNPRLQPGVRVLGGGPQVVIPTTEEMMRFINTVDPSALTSIRELELLSQQVADEKVAIADQTFALVDAVVKRLDADLEAMEKTLQSTGEFQVEGVARPDDLAAVQVTSGSDWILAKVISHDPSTGFYKLSDEDVESNKSKSFLWDILSSLCVDGIP